jgi:hypothetical protein
MTYCEDYPACGHTPLDPCARQWYDEPGAFDTSIPGNEHAFCEHEFGMCDVEYDDDVYWPGTGELQSDDSYIDYLNRY